MADYQGALAELGELGIEVAGALSAQSRDEAGRTVEELGLTFPVAYGLEIPAAAERIGAFWDGERGIVQPTTFLLRDRAILQSTYSSGSQGRLWSRDVLALVGFLQKLERQRAGG